MNYDRVILELIDRVSRLESELSALKEELSQFSNSSACDDECNNISASTSRDTTKYILDGKRYGKNRLVLAVVQKYIESHPNITATQLMEVFDRSLQGSLGVIRSLNDVKKSYADYEVRFFCQPEEIIHTSTEDCVVCTQWGKFNIGNFITRSKQLDISIDEI